MWWRKKVHYQAKITGIQNPSIDDYLNSYFIVLKYIVSGFAAVLGEIMSFLPMVTLLKSL